jgi:hypothetical protein
MLDSALAVGCKLGIEFAKVRGEKTEESAEHLYSFYATNLERQCSGGPPLALRPNQTTLAVSIWKPPSSFLGRLYVFFQSLASNPSVNHYRLTLVHYTPTPQMTP